MSEKIPPKGPRLDADPNILEIKRDELKKEKKSEPSPLEDALNKLLDLCVTDAKEAWNFTLTNHFAGLMLSQAIEHKEDWFTQQLKENPRIKQSKEYLIFSEFKKLAYDWMDRLWNFGLEVIDTDEKWGVGIGALLHIWRSYTRNLEAYTPDIAGRIILMMQEIGKRAPNPDAIKYADYNAQQVEEFDDYLTDSSEKRQQIARYIANRTINADIVMDTVERFGWEEAVRTWFAILKRRGPLHHYFIDSIAYHLANKLERALPSMKDEMKKTLSLYVPALKQTGRVAPDTSVPFIKSKANLKSKTKTKSKTKAKNKLKSKTKSKPKTKTKSKKKTDDASSSS